MIAKFLLYAIIDCRRKSSTVNIRGRDNGNALARYNSSNDSRVRHTARSDDTRTATGGTIKATVGRQPTLRVDSCVNLNTVVTGRARDRPNNLFSIRLAELSNILIQIAISDQVILVCF